MVGVFGVIFLLLALFVTILGLLAKIQLDSDFFLYGTYPVSFFLAFLGTAFIIIELSVDLIFSL